MSSGGAEPETTQSRSQEIRKLKIAGIVLIAMALPAFAYLGEQIDAQLWRHASVSQLALWAVIYICAANVLALGLIVLFAGFSGRPLVSDTRARRGVLVKLAGANLLIVCVAFVALEDLQVWRGFEEESWLYLLALALFVAAGRIGVLVARRGWKYDAVSAEALLERDTRPPVVYIRSFMDDHQIMPASGVRRWLAEVFAWTVAVSAEQELSIIMSRVGPVVAIGKPGEPLPELGAARLYVGDDQWQAKITAMMQQSRLVVVRLGSTANLWWEIDQAMKLVPRRDIILILLTSQGNTALFDPEIERRFGRPEVVARKKSPISVLMGWLWPIAVDLGSVIYFDKRARPVAEPIQFSYDWRSAVLMPFRPFQGPLTAAIRRVFKELDLPWVEQKSRATAALLAVFFGWFGFHHFYLGRRRRALYYLAFSWTMVPLFLAWIDAVRFALADERQFQEKFAIDPDAIKAPEITIPG